MTIPFRGNRALNLLLVTLFVAFAALPARAQLSLSFTPVGDVSVTLGESVLLTALLENTSLTESIELFGAAGTLTGPGNVGLSVDDSAFLSGLPLELAAGESYSGTIAVGFTSQASPGSYFLTYSVDGQGVTSGTPFTGTGEKTLLVQSASTIAPEPGTLVLLFPALVGAAGVILRCRSARILRSRGGYPSFLCLLIWLLLVPVPAQAQNVALNKPVSVSNGSVNGVALSTLTDGVFRPRSTQWQTGTVWWIGLSPTLTIDLQGIFLIKQLVVQGDDNDSYRVDYLDANDQWHPAYDVPVAGGWGMQTRPNPANDLERYTLPIPVMAKALRVYATGGDNSYSVSEVQAFVADETAPETAITSGPVGGAAVGTSNVTFGFTGTDAQTPTANLTYRYRVDGGAWQGPIASTSVTVNDLSEGAHTFEVAAIDTAGNIDPTPAVANFVVDLTPPAFTQGPTVTNSKYNSVQVNWTTDDAVAGTIEVAYNDGTPFSPIASFTDTRHINNHAFVIGPLHSSTAYRLRIRSGDPAGNVTTSAIVPFTTPALRDLQLKTEDVQFSNNGPASGDAITMSVKVHNPGDVTLNGTLVFYDYSPSTGTREVSRHPVSVAAKTANPPTITSAPFTVGEGAHTPYAQILNVAPGDDIPANNAAGRDLNVGAPARRLRVVAADQRTFPGDNRLLGVVVKNTGSQPYFLVAPVISGVNYLTSVGPLPATTLAPGEETTLLFRLQTPANEPGGPANNPVKKPVTIALEEFSAAFTLEVYSQAVSSLDVTVLDDTTGLPINGALVATDTSDTLYVTGPDGKLRLAASGQPTTLPVFPGTVTLFGYKEDYIAKSSTLEAVAGEQEVTLRLIPGKTLEVTAVTARPLTQTEIQQRGVNLQDPENYVVYDFVIAMRIGSVTIPNIAVPVGGTVPTVGGGTFEIPGGGSIFGGTLNIQWKFDPAIGTETWIIIPGDVRILKQFFDATVFVRNNSDTVAVNNLVASLSIPDGIGLPDLDGVPQSLSQSLGSLAPREEAQANWVIRGDKAGTYRLTGTATGTVQIGGSSIPLSSTLQSDEFSVIIPNIRMGFETPTGVVAGEEFTIGITVLNPVPIDLNGVTVNIKENRLINCHLAPGETASHYLGTIPVGQSKKTSFRFISHVTGKVLEVRTWVSPLPVEPDISVVPAPNAAPDAVDDSATTSKNTPVTLSPLSNDTDPETDPLSVTAVSAPANGTAVRNANGTVTYTPASNYVGPDSFTYTISDGNGNSDTATVQVQVNDPNAGPARLAISGVQMTRSGGVLTAQVTLRNDGGSPATNIRVTSSQLGSASTTTSPLPTVATLNSGQTTVITLTYPGSAGNTGATPFLRVVGTFTGGNFNSSRRVTLP